jgi:hypothetical protein
MSVSLPFSAAAPHLLAYARGRPTGQDVDRPTLVFSPASTCMHGLPIMCSFFWFVGTWDGIGFSFRYGALVPSCVPNLWTRHLSRPSHHIVVLATAKSRSPIHGACMIWLSIGAWPSCGHVWSLDTFSWTGTVTVGTTEMIVPVPLVRTAPMCLRLYPCWRVDQFVSHNAWSTPFSS